MPIGIDQNPLFVKVDNIKIGASKPELVADLKMRTTRNITDGKAIIKDDGYSWRKDRHLHSVAELSGWYNKSHFFDRDIYQTIQALNSNELEDFYYNHKSKKTVVGKYGNAYLMYSFLSNLKIIRDFKIFYETNRCIHQGDFLDYDYDRVLNFTSTDIMIALSFYHTSMMKECYTKLNNILPPEVVQDAYNEKFLYHISLEDIEKNATKNFYEYIPRLSVQSKVESAKRLVRMFTNDKPYGRYLMVSHDVNTYSGDGRKTWRDSSRIRFYNQIGDTEGLHVRRRNAYVFDVKLFSDAIEKAEKDLDLEKIHNQQKQKEKLIREINTGYKWMKLIASLDEDNDYADIYTDDDKVEHGNIYDCRVANHKIKVLRQREAWKKLYTHWCNITGHNIYTTDTTKLLQDVVFTLNLYTAAKGNDRSISKDELEKLKIYYDKYVQENGRYVSPLDNIEETFSEMTQDKLTKVIDIASLYKNRTELFGDDDTYESFLAKDDWYSLEYKLLAIKERFRNIQYPDNISLLEKMHYPYTFGRDKIQHCIGTMNGMTEEITTAKTYIKLGKRKAADRLLSMIETKEATPLKAEAMSQETTVRGEENE